MIVKLLRSDGGESIMNINNPTPAQLKKAIRDWEAAHANKVGEEDPPLYKVKILSHVVIEE